VASVVNRLRQMVAHTQEEARRSVAELRARAMETDFPAVLQRLLQAQVPAEGPPEFDLVVEGEPWPLPALVRHHLLRSAQEAVGNALSHARARTLRVRLRYEPEQLRLCVEDDGVGFDVTRATRELGHFGLLSLRERTAKIGARLHLESAPGQGTRVEILLPRSSLSEYENEENPAVDRG
jgi:signal transduction histidine kinase